jgi:hypothetical protein
MNSTKLIAAEYMVAVGIVSWSAIKGKSQDVLVDRDPPTKESRAVHYWPWPPTVIMTSTAFGILGMFATVQPELAGILGAGFLLAQIVRTLGKGDFFELSGIPNSAAFKLYNETQPDGSYYRILTF